MSGIKWLLSILILILLSCTDGSMIRKDDPAAILPEEGKSKIVIIRNKTYGFLVVNNVYLEHKLIGRTSVRSYFSYVTEPGTRYIFTGNNKEGENIKYRTTRFHFKPGKVYYLENRPVPDETFVLLPLSVESFERYARVSRYNSLRDDIIDSIDVDIDSLKAVYLQELQDDPDRHADNENYEGY
ncbi:MAG: hypothetical protein GX556_13840 [Fibrobacter sp.]|nr:hypothetical protein [Fibrobacter sp.]